jgi:hypothetical protein
MRTAGPATGPAQLAQKTRCSGTIVCSNERGTATLLEFLLHPLIPSFYLRNLAIPVDLSFPAPLSPATLTPGPRRAPRQRLVEFVAMDVLHLLDLRELGVVDERASALRLRAIEVELRGPAE